STRASTGAIGASCSRAGAPTSRWRASRAAPTRSSSRQRTTRRRRTWRTSARSCPTRARTGRGCSAPESTLAVALLDRRELGEVALDALLELVRFGADHREARLAPRTLAMAACLAAVTLRQPRPLFAD